MLVQWKENYLRDWIFPRQFAAFPGKNFKEYKYILNYKQNKIKRNSFWKKDRECKLFHKIQTKVNGRNKLFKKISNTVFKYSFVKLQKRKPYSINNNCWINEEKIIQWTAILSKKFQTQWKENFKKPKQSKL